MFSELLSFCLESKNLPGRPPLEITVAHSRNLLNLMADKVTLGDTDFGLDLVDTAQSTMYIVQCSVHCNYCHISKYKRY